MEPQAEGTDLGVEEALKNQVKAQKCRFVDHIPLKNDLDFMHELKGY